MKNTHMRFPMNTYQGKEASRGKPFVLNVITSLNFFQMAIFFKWRFPFSHM